MRRRRREGKDGASRARIGGGKGDVRYWDVDRDESRVDESARNAPRALRRDDSPRYLYIRTSITRRRREFALEVPEGHLRRYLELRRVDAPPARTRRGAAISSHVPSPARAAVHPPPRRRPRPAQFRGEFRGSEKSAPRRATGAPSRFSAGGSSASSIHAECAVRSSLEGLNQGLYPFF